MDDLLENYTDQKENNLNSYTSLQKPYKTGKLNTQQEGRP